jgi:hypothetical protein
VRCPHQTSLGVDAKLAKGTVDHTADPTRSRTGIDISILMRLVKESNDLIALLELGHLSTDFHHFSSTVRVRDNRILVGKGKSALFDIDRIG